MLLPRKYAPFPATHGVYIVFPTMFPNTGNRQHLLPWFPTTLGWFWWLCSRFGTQSSCRPWLASLLPRWFHPWIWKQVWWFRVLFWSYSRGWRRRRCEPEEKLLVGKLEALGWWGQDLVEDQPYVHLWHFWPPIPNRCFRRSISVQWNSFWTNMWRERVVATEQWMRVSFTKCARATGALMD